MPDRSLLRIALASGLAFVSACGRCGSEDEVPTVGDAPAHANADEKPTDAELEAKQAGDPAPTDDVPAGPELQRAETPLSVGAKAAKHLGYDVKYHVGLYALAGRVTAAPWSAAGSSAPELARDDDLRTGWKCTPTPESPCALGLSSAAPLRVKAVRLFTAHGPDYRDYTGGARIAKVRVHTDAGHADVALDGAPHHEMIVFAEPVQTHTLTVEVLESTPGKRGAEIVIAELDAIGPEGPARPPLDLDPSRSFVTYETDPWKSRGAGDHIARMVFVEVLSDDGKPMRIARGSALLGRKGDRFLLLERLSTAKCDPSPWAQTEGSWWLLDQHTRMLLPLGTMGGVPATVRVHPEGLGFAFQHRTGLPHAVVLEDGGPKIHHPKKKATDATALLAAWGFVEAPVLRRGGWRLPELPTTCSAATDHADALAAALGREAKPARAEDFFVCRIGDTTAAIIGSRGTCGSDWSLVAASSDLTSDKRNRRHAKKEADARGIRVAPIEGGLLVELSKNEGKSANLYLVTEGPTLVELAKGAGLAVHAPGVCDACDDRFDRSEALPTGAPEADVPGEPALPTLDPADAAGDEAEAEPEDDAEPEAEAELQDEAEPAPGDTDDAAAPPDDPEPAQTEG